MECSSPRWWCSTPTGWKPSIARATWRRPGRTTTSRIDGAGFSELIGVAGLTQINRLVHESARLCGRGEAGAGGDFSPASRSSPDDHNRGDSTMGVHEWARQQIEQSLQQASAQGFDPALGLRALLGAVVELSRGERDAKDLAAELQFLADNLDDERDYGFMRP